MNVNVNGTPSHLNGTPSQRDTLEKKEKRVREAEVCFAELPFIYKTQFGILKGQIDLVIRLKTGEWIIAGDRGV